MAHFFFISGVLKCLIFTKGEKDLFRSRFWRDFFSLQNSIFDHQYEPINFYSAGLLKNSVFQLYQYLLFLNTQIVTDFIIHILYIDRQVWDHIANPHFLPSLSLFLLKL